MATEWLAEAGRAPVDLDFGALARAKDPSVPASELLSLAVSRDSSVRAAVAARPDCPAGALISLGHDHRPEVLLALISNPRTPSSVVRNLADHRVQQVADAAEQRLRSIYA
ncbi:MAG: hypothetical protein NVV57_07570 [Demequina sp.]|nr:hypothetical protein [Demequina sp.]